MGRSTSLELRPVDSYYQINHSTVCRFYLQSVNYANYSSCRMNMGEAISRPRVKQHNVEACIHHNLCQLTRKIKKINNNHKTSILNNKPRQNILYNLIVNAHNYISKYFTHINVMYFSIILQN